MATPMQAKLLRVLEERSVVRLGGTRAIPVDVRVVAATNVDLPRAMQEGKFREDLYHRINVIEIPMPPLRDRTATCRSSSPTSSSATRNCARRRSRAFAPAALDRLAAHRWPGNVRELENVLQRALVVAPGPRLEAQDLRFANHVAPRSPQATGRLDPARQLDRAGRGNPDRRRARAHGWRQGKGGEAARHLRAHALPAHVTRTENGDEDEVSRSPD
jgi:DNA-binding NtrC family response regulator